MLPSILSDSYKQSHYQMYIASMNKLYSNLTPRRSRLKDTNKVIFFGLQYFLLKYLIEEFNNNFFLKPKEEVINEHRRVVGPFSTGPVITEQWEALHDLGYMPLKIKAVPEGTAVPIGVPMLTVTNTHPNFGWLVNFIETILSTTIWQPITSATIIKKYRQLSEKYCEMTGGDFNFLDFQNHDFSMRGMSSLETACTSGAGHLTSSKGSDTIPASVFLEMYYGAKGDIAYSVAASEHSVMSVGGKDGEINTLQHLLKAFPKGILSCVSDTWDLWKLLTEYLPTLKEDIMAREGKLVIRPDSGDPADIICGTMYRDLSNYKIGDTFLQKGRETEDNGRVEHYSDITFKILPEHKGVIELLWDIFGRTINEKGYKVLDSHIGAIYGDSITLERAEEILERLKQKGFCSTNIVFGVGSFCVTEDTPILCEDLSWKKAGELREGDKIVSFNENPLYGTGKKKTPSRKYEVSEITHNHIEKRSVLKLNFENGESLECTGEHSVLVLGSMQNREDFYDIKPSKEEVKQKNMPRGKGLIWKKAKNIVPGDQVAYFGKPWEEDQNLETSWLRGIYDGEGSIYTGKAGKRRFATIKVNLSQNEGIVLDQARRILKDLNFSFYENATPSGCIRNCLTGGFYEHARFLGTVRPIRFMQKVKGMDFYPAFKKNDTYSLVTVDTVEKETIKNVAVISTLNGTLVTNGILSHNTYQHNTRDTFGMAMKATYCEVDGVGRSIFKDPITDSGEKKSAKGLLLVEYDDHVPESLKLIQGVSWDMEKGGELVTVFEDSKMVKEYTLEEIRERVKQQTI